VRSELKGTGLGHLLMDKLIRYLRAHGTQKLVATVLRENQRMLALAQELGFQPSAEQPDPETVAIELPLN
jgi:acetyltransferase